MNQRIVGIYGSFIRNAAQELQNSRRFLAVVVPIVGRERADELLVEANTRAIVSTLSRRQALDRIEARVLAASTGSELRCLNGCGARGPHHCPGLTT